MNLEEIREHCLGLPSTAEDVKWKHELCFLVVNKIFCIIPLNREFSVCLKVTKELFIELIELDGIIPAPYLARNNWVLITDPIVLSKIRFKELILESYNLICANIPKSKFLRKRTTKTKN